MLIYFYFFTLPDLQERSVTLYKKIIEIEMATVKYGLVSVLARKKV